MPKCQNIPRNKLPTLARLATGHPHSHNLSNRQPKSLVTIFTAIIVVITSLLCVVKLDPVPQSPINKSICDLSRSIVYCNCNHDPAFMITCFTVNSTGTNDDPVWDLFKQQTELQKLTVAGYQNTTFNFLPTKAINIVREKVENMRFSQLNLQKLKTGMIQNLPVLEEVEFSVCNITEAEVNTFQSLHKLTKLIINRNNITVLRDLFEDVPKLSDLYLEDNNIQQIEDGAFSALTTLVYLTLERNLIEKIHRRSFIGLENLKSIDITRNMLTSLPANLFAEMPKLDRIDLGYNKISSIDENVFVGLTDLQILKLEHNKLQSFSSAAVFSHNQNLQMLDIGFNDFEELSRQVFYQPQTARYIRLRIKGNKLHCTCSLLWLNDALKSFDSIVKKELETIDCNYPAESPFGDTSKQQSILKYITSDKTAEYCFKATKLIMPPLPAINTDRVNSGEDKISIPIDTVEELPIRRVVDDNPEGDNFDHGIHRAPNNEDKAEQDRQKNDDYETEKRLSQASLGGSNGSGNKLHCTCSLLWLNDALKSFDSIVKKELETIDCNYPAESPFGDTSKQQSILKYITSDKTAEYCFKATKLIMPPLPAINTDRVNSGEDKISIPIDTVEELPIRRVVDDNPEGDNFDHGIHRAPNNEDKAEQDRQKNDDYETEKRLSQASLGGSNGSGTIHSLHKLSMNLLISVTLTLCAKFYIL